MRTATWLRAGQILKRGGIGVLPTDTIYGLVGSALSRRAIERLYRVRRRDAAKPFIILIGDMKDLALFGVRPRADIKRILRQIWPGRISVILPCAGAKFRYLHRGSRSLAFRLPKDRVLRLWLKRTGPLAAPSANLAGRSAATSLMEAKRYFGGQSDFYIDGGTIRGAPSWLIDLRTGRPAVLRKGSGKLKLK